MRGEMRPSGARPPTQGSWKHRALASQAYFNLSAHASRPFTTGRGPAWRTPSHDGSSPHGSTGSIKGVAREKDLFRLVAFVENHVSSLSSLKVLP